MSMWLRVAMESREGMLELPFPEEASPEPGFAVGSSHREDLSVKWLVLLLSLGSSPSDEDEGEGEGPDCGPV